MKTRPCLVMGWVLLPVVAGAATSTWNNTTGNWNDSTRWGGGTPYASVADVGIATGGTLQTVATNDFWGELRICTNATLSLVTGQSSSCSNLHLLGGRIAGGTHTMAGVMSVDADSFIISSALTSFNLTNTISGVGTLTVTNANGLIPLFVSGTNTAYLGNWNLCGTGSGYTLFTTPQAIGNGRVNVGSGGYLRLPSAAINNRIALLTNGCLTLKDNTASPNPQDLHLNGGTINKAITSATSLGGTATVESVSYLQMSGLAGNVLSATLLGAGDLVENGTTACDISGTNVEWSGNWEVRGSELRITSSNAMGAGSQVTINAGKTFSLWSNGNVLSKNVLASGTLQSGIGSSGGGANQALLISGADLRCGTNNGVGIFTIQNAYTNTYTLAVVFTNSGTRYPSITCPVSGTGGVAGVDHGQLRCPKGNVLLNGNVDLAVTIAPGLHGLAGQTLVLVTNATSGISGTFRRVSITGGVGGSLSYTPAAVTLTLHPLGTAVFLR